MGFGIRARWEEVGGDSVREQWVDILPCDVNRRRGDDAIA